MARRLAGSGGSRGGSARDNHVVTNGSSFLLDNFTHTPKFAGWLGGRLRSAYSSYICRIRRGSDSATLDVGYDAHGIVDTAAIAAHCAGTTGYLVTLYDQSGNGNHITQATTTKQPIVYASAALKAGATGYLAALFDGVDDFLLRADTLGLSGDVALTSVADVGGASEFMYGGLLAIGDDGSGTRRMLALAAYFSTDDNENETDYSNTVFAHNSVAGGLITSTWLQSSRAAGADISAVELRINGSVDPQADTTGSGSLSLSGGAFSWGAYTDGRYPLGDNAESGGTALASVGICWNAVLGAAEQTALDAWMLSHHA